MAEKFGSHSHKPQKKFGQNFLQDQTIIHRIVNAIAPQKDDRLVEIGPGLGALTQELLPLVNEMDAVEIDRDLIPKLIEKSKNIGKLTIYQQDVLTFEFSQLSSALQKKLRVVGNLPYNISTPLLFHLFEQKQFIQDMHFMLQKEVGDRLAAHPGNKDYGRLSVMAQYHCEIVRLFTVPPEAFWPKPKVFSTVLRLIPKQAGLVAKDYAIFKEIVKLAFNQRRKTIKNSLKNLVTAEILLELNIDPSIRPEQISLENYVKISNRVTQKKS